MFSMFCGKFHLLYSNKEFRKSVIICQRYCGNSTALFWHPLYIYWNDYTCIVITSHTPCQEKGATLFSTIVLIRISCSIFTARRMLAIVILSVYLSGTFLLCDSYRGATTFSKLGVQFLGLWYYYSLQKKIGLPSLVQSVTLKLRKKLGVRQNFGQVPPTPSGCAHGQLKKLCRYHTKELFLSMLQSFFMWKLSAAKLYHNHSPI